ncbi:bifunctional helix-turn-helix transcriptional regulator/GNAT family N-acetyltransferase [Paraburkholderia sp. DHOC27]|uniref:bifunctional helix-turn-helix transcriptional regulator/GNAT family N-acetyltransferase n=1 Tax=Paraburkholderia sp. DHOC27 TaxID=2303330 RepID=UPI000E3BD8D1|nr:bifunctional helix-turn-helix transcriptional regulator/GNAT family N-acetyltransferase [Paraburkholderia sp. DHOC27]RFU47111.1 GNAT family N-acetyltransferase [Paraburkholderia sp. DHOC27]
MTDSTALRRAEAVRHFNRFYTQHVGAMHERLQKSPFSLTEVRVLHELTRGRAQTAAALARNLGLDSGYLSRLLTSFERRALITRRPSESDARQSLIALTDQGHAAYEPLDAAAIEEVLAVLERLQASSQDQLIGAMKLVERLLGDRSQRGTVTLRAPRPGEYGWLVHRQAAIFADEHNWDQAFEGLLARVIADFTQHHDPLRETCWVAEQDGMIVGSALVMSVSTTIARIRLLYIEPDMRRMGIGTQLVEECVRFAQRAGYTKLTLSIATALEASRQLCERTGFVYAGGAPEIRFGHDLTIERWERDL